MTSKIMTIGGITYDAIIDYKDPETLSLQSATGSSSYVLLEEGKKIEVTELTGTSGGGATNSAVTFQRLGFDVSCFCQLGTDVIGDHILAELKQFAVPTAHIQRTDKAPTASSFVVPSLKGDRTVFAFRGANALLNEAELPWDDIRACDQLYITSLSGPSAGILPKVTAYAAEHGIRVALNPGISQLRDGGSFIAESLQYVDALMLNSEEAKQLMASLVRLSLGEHDSHAVTAPDLAKQKNYPDLLFNAIYHEEVSFSLLDFFARVRALGPKTVVVTDGGAGVYVAVEGNVYYHKSIAGQVVNTLGAGDAFSSSFIAAQCLGHSIETAIRWGIANSASVIAYPDAKTGLLNSTVLQQRADTLAADALAIYDIAV